MTWRSYVDPTTGQWYTTDDGGNFLPGNNAGAWNLEPAAGGQLGQNRFGISPNDIFAIQQQYQQALLQSQNEQFAFSKAMQMMGLIAQLRGPRNAFQQQAVMMGLNKAGLSNAVGALKGTFAPPSFWKPQATPQAATPDTLQEDLENPPNYDAYLAALPNPNKIVGRNFLDMSGDTQDWVLSGYEAKGYSGNDVLNAINRTRPQFAAPRWGGVAA